MSAQPVRQFNVGPVPVLVFERKRDMGAAAARRAADIMGRAIQDRGKARVIVGTGNSQDEVIDELTRQPIDWQAVEVFHMDEYVGMAHTHTASFRRWLRTRLADVVNPAATHYIDGDAADIDAAIKRYSDLLTAETIDVCFCGFGENGHIAFNDPHVADFEDPATVKCVELDEKCRLQQVGEGHFPSLDEAPHLFHQPDGSVIARWIVDGEVHEKTFASGAPIRLPAFENLLGAEFVLAPHTPDPATLPMPERVFVLGDVEGEYDALCAMLRAGGVIDDDGHWSYGRGHLVSVGDMVDRGKHVTEVLWLMYRLEREAEARLPSV